MCGMKLLIHSQTSTVQSQWIIVHSDRKKYIVTIVLKHQTNSQLTGRSDCYIGTINQNHNQIFQYSGI